LKPVLAKPIISVDAEKRKDKNSMNRYECPCGYVYEPAEADAERNIPIGTAFEDLPDDWVCPLCGAEKEYFERLDD
jgi:rubredoxin